ncbi:MAG: fused DSP-PTPase phosphatase/NAD kinase-like protein [Planctomycetota bacterium]
MRKRLFALAAALAGLAASWSCASTPPPTSTPSPASTPAPAGGPDTVAAAGKNDPQPSHPAWAEHLHEPDLTNFCRVNAHLYRGAQPDEAGFKRLHALGIRTVINLRTFHSDDDEVKEAGVDGQLQLEHIYCKTWHPELEDIRKFLTLACDPKNQPVYVHCQFGSDRTGTMCAVYRIVVQGWTRDQAIDEMTHGGYGFHPIWQNLVDFIHDDLDDRTLAELRQDVARVAQPSTPGKADPNAAPTAPAEPTAPTAPAAPTAPVPPARADGSP